MRNPVIRDWRKWRWRPKEEMGGNWEQEGERESEGERERERERVLKSVAFVCQIFKKEPEKCKKCICLLKSLVYGIYRDYQNVEHTP